jgi:hypothetical protein
VIRRANATSYVLPVIKYSDGGVVVRHQSGIGTEFAEEGLAEFTQLQIINGPPA